MFEIVSLLLGPAVVAGVVAQAFNLFRPSRMSERVSAFKDELEALRQTNDGTSLGKAAYAVSRGDVESALINRLSPSRSPQNFGLLLLSVGSIVFVAFIFSIAHPQGVFQHVILWGGSLIYSVFALFSFAMSALGAFVSGHVRMMLSTGFRMADHIPNGELREAFTGLRAVFRDCAPGEQEEYRFRPRYQFSLSQTTRTRLRIFMRELDRPVGDYRPQESKGNI